MINILHLNSTSLSFLTSKGTSVLQPCFARRENENWIFADTDNCQFHTDDPDYAVNTYFLKCDQDRNIARGNWQGRPIDLVYEQLLNLLGNNSEGLILLLSSIYSEIQIEYLSGVLKEISNSIAIVKAPLAYSYTISPGKYAIIEVEMHDVVLTKLDITSGLATITERPRRFEDISLQRIYNEQYSIIKESFIERHRYDPDHVTANKAMLLNQLYDRWDNSNVAEICLEAGDCKVHIAVEHLKRMLPDKVLNEIEDRVCWLSPAPLIPVQNMISGVPVLDSLGGKHAEILSNSACLQYLKQKDTRSIRAFHAIEHQQIV